MAVKFSNPFDKGFNTGPISSLSSGWDTFLNGNTNKVNEKIAEDNLQFQRENLAYQKALQQKIFDREDSAYQRTVKDMRAAGLSPLMMNGTNGAGEAIQTEPLQNNFQYQSASPIGALSSVFNTASTVHQTYQKAKMNEASINSLNASTEGQKINNMFLPFSLSTSLIGQILSNKNTSADIRNKTADYGLKMLQTLNQSMQNEDLARWNEYAKFFGISSNMSEKEKLLKLGQSLIDDNNSKNPIKDVNDAVTGFIEGQSGSEGIAGTLADALPKSWSDAIDSALEEAGNYLDKNYKKHGFKFWRYGN